MTLLRTPADALQERAAAPQARSRGHGVVSPFSGDTAVVLVARMLPGSVLWGWSRLVRGPGALRHERGLRFAKILGSGQDGRFGLRPGLDVQGLFALFEDGDSATRFVERSDVVHAWRDHAGEIAIARLRACSSRGTWSGHAIGVGTGVTPGGRIASLTRASIRPTKALQFWRRAPPAQTSLEDAEGCEFAVGLGEAPLLRQATFSIWRSAKAMDAFARHGAHLEAIRASQRGGHFSESMFVRFEVLGLEGFWGGVELG